MSEPQAVAPRRPARAELYAFLFFLIAPAIVLIHAPYLDLPFFWDELGQFIPASLDLFWSGWWVPRSTVPNVHPPGLMAYLAGVWHLTGYSVIATRVAMLLMASATVLVVFLLAIRLCQESRGAPAFLPVAFLIVSPLFYMQAMMAQLDLPATLFTTLALLLFLQDRWLASALACVALVWMKETGLIVPALLGVWLFWERRWRQALYFILPALALAVWLLVLRQATGSWFGNQEFADYNLRYPLHPVRVGFAFLRRVGFLVFEQFHWIGWLAIFYAFRRTPLFRQREWRIAALMVAAHVVMLSLVGGANLERYLLPVLPLLYIAMGAAWMYVPAPWRAIGIFTQMAGLMVWLFLGPPYSYPLDNNLAMVHFVRLHQTAAHYLEESYPDETVVTAWPFSAALRRPDYGYVRRRVPARNIPDFKVSTWERLRPEGVRVVALYSRDWEPPWSVLRWPVFDRWRRIFYGHEPAITPQQLAERYGLRPVIRFDRGGQWLEIFARDLPPPRTPGKIWSISH
jgi:hypothetical protein